MPSRKSSTRPARIRETGSTNDVSHLEGAVTEIADNLARLTERLVGDEKLQTKGLIHEFQDQARSTAERFSEQDKINREMSDTLVKINGRLEAYETFRAAQEAANKRFEDTTEKFDSASKMAIGGWKLAGIVASIVVACSGAITWVLSKIYGAHP